MKWYIPSFHGDISLEEKGKETLLLATNLSPDETKALKLLRDKALCNLWGLRPWTTAEEFRSLDSPSYRTAAGVQIRLAAPLATVQKFLAKALKPDRILVQVVKHRDGKLAEPAVESSDAPTAQPDPVVGTTVAKPVVGCPAPDFSPAEIRATRVLEQFLNEAQIEDFRRFNRFVTVGADTGHRYMLTSRLQRDQLGNFAGRSLYDLDERRAYCVHDWEVPAAEELLALHLFLSLPTREAYLRSIPD